MLSAVSDGRQDLKNLDLVFSFLLLRAALRLLTDLLTLHRQLRCGLTKSWTLRLTLILHYCFYFHYLDYYFCCHHPQRSLSSSQSCLWNRACRRRNQSFALASAWSSYLRFSRSHIQTHSCLWRSGAMELTNATKLAHMKGCFELTEVFITRGRCRHICINISRFLGEAQLNFLLLLFVDAGP